MNASPAVIELFAALRRSSSGSVPEPDAHPVGAPVASVLQPTHSSEHANQHPYDSLRAALALRRNGTLRKLARELGFENKDAGALSDLLHGRYDHVSLLTANRWALALGLPLIPSTKSVQVCPSCLERGIAVVHDVGDCMGRPISAVVILAPGERVTAAPPPAAAGDPARLLTLVERWTAEDALEDGANVSRETWPASRKRKMYHSRPCLSTDPTERIAQCERIIEEARKATCYLSTR